MQEKIQNLINYIANTFLSKGHDAEVFNKAKSVLFGGPVMYVIDDDLKRHGTIYFEKEGVVYVHNDQDRTNFVFDEDYAALAAEVMDEMSYDIWKKVHLLVGEVSETHSEMD